MIRVQMGEIRRDGVVIPGGWTAKIPSAQLYENELQVYAGYYVRNYAMHEGAAFKRVEGDIEALWIRAWTDGLRNALTNMARRYSRMFPDLGLAGFDPEAMQAGYIPGERVGRTGKPAVKRLLFEMGMRERERRAREERDE